MSLPLFFPARRAATQPQEQPPVRGAAPRLVIALCCMALTISACTRVDTQPDPAPDWAREVLTLEPPLPAGAVREPAGSEEALDVDTAETVASLRPDERTPDERVPEIVERGRITVGVDQSQNLLSYRDPATGELSGFEIDIAREIARDIFGDPHAVDFRFIDSADRINALEAETVDIVVRTMAITPQRQSKVAFSVPYFTSQTKVLAHRGSGISGVHSLHGRTVCVADHTTALQHARSFAPYADILRVRNWADCLVALQQEQAQAIISDDAILAGIAAQDPTTEIVGTPIGEESYGVGIAQPRADKDTTGLIRQVNSTLARILSDGTWEAIYARTLGRHHASVTRPVPHYADDETRLYPEATTARTEGDNL